MLELRNDKICAESEQDLLGERTNIAVGALGVRLGANQAAPEIRAFVGFHVEVGGRKHGPFRAEVVHQAGSMLGLHLTPEAMSGLLALCDSLEAGIPEDRPALGRATMGASALEGELAEAASEVAATLEVAGTLDGHLSVGVLRDLLVTTPAPAPAARTSAIQLFRYLGQERASGTLVIRGTTHVKQVLLHDGVILRVDVDPPKEDEMLGQILLKVRWISPQQLAGALRWGRSDGSSLGATMVRTGLLEERKLGRALAHQTYRRLRDLVEWSGARFWFEPKAEAEGHKTPLSIDRLMAELALDVLRDTTLQQLELLVQHQADRYPSLDLSVSPDRFRLLVPEEKTRRVCEQIFDGSRPLRLAIQSSVLGRQRTTRLVLYLNAAGALRMTVDPVLQHLTPAQQLSEHLRTLEVQDAYQRLGLRYRAHPNEIDAAYATASASLAESSPLYRAGPRSADKGRILLDEARTLLSRPTSRIKCRRKAVGKEGIAFFSKLVADELLLAELHGEAPRQRKLQEVLQELRVNA